MSETMTSADTSSPAVPESAYIAALWEHSSLCIAHFGLQFVTPEGKALYETTGISEELRAPLQGAPGLLCSRFLMGPDEGVIVQYWRDYESLHTWARVMPHTKWWRWLVENHGNGPGFYHEIYTLRGAEAIYEKSPLPVGPATLCSLQSVRSGEGCSRQRMEQYAVAQEQLGGART